MTPAYGAPARPIDIRALDYDEPYTRLLQGNALKLSALAYARRGVAVFPLVPGGKTPMTKNGFKGATTDAATINRWWTATPQANIGAPTGVTFDVIDIDGWTGVDSMLDAYGTLEPAELGIIGRSVTPRGGGHHLFLPAAEGRKNSTGLLPGVDVRATGGYVVMAPSRGANGRLYRWLTPLVLAGEG